MKKNRFKIDFFEFSFLVEACIPPNPIARNMFWKRVIDEHYYEMKPDERSRLWEWINRNPAYEQGIKNGNEDCLVFEARFNPENQYLITTKYNDKLENFVCFKWNDRYHTSITTSIVEEHIKTIVKLKK